MYFIFKNYSFAKVISFDAIRLGSFCETYNIDRNGVNKQNTQTHQTIREI